jgi:hypothetical protein
MVHELLVPHCPPGDQVIDFVLAKPRVQHLLATLPAPNLKFLFLYF